MGNLSSQISALCPLQVLDLAAVFSVETCTVALPLSYRGIFLGNLSSQISALCPLQVLDLAAVFSVETCTVALPLSYRGILCGNDLSSRQVTLQVLSARQSLTSVFGMRTGGPLRYHHHNGYIICILYTGYIRLFFS